MKLRFFGSEESWRRHAPADGFWVGAEVTLGRINGTEYDDHTPHPLLQYARRAALDRSHINYINARFEGDTVTSRFESMSTGQSAGRLTAER